MPTGLEMVPIQEELSGFYAHFFVSTVMAILPVYTTSKLHAARINLRQTPSSTPGVSFNYVKGHGFGRKWAFRRRASALDLMNPPS